MAVPLARASHVQQGLTLSLLAHVLLLLAIGLLLAKHETPPVPLEPSIALVFAPPSPPVEAPAPPAAEPAPPPPQPVVQPLEPPREQTDPFAHAPPPRYTEQARAPPQHVARVAPPTQPTHTTEAPVQQAAAAAPAAITSAHPVSGMESDRPPVYPETARKRGQQGRVVVRVNVSADGRPVSVSVEQGSGYASLDQAAVNAVEKWHFIPATRDGAPVPAVADVPVRFQLID